jgi:flagellar biosynthesis protein FlhF
MRIKKFTASSVQEATELMRRDFGGEAIILNTRQVHQGGMLNFFGKNVIEITAAVDDKPVVSRGPIPGGGVKAAPRMTPATVSAESTVEGLRKVAEQFGQKTFSDRNAGNQYASLAEFATLRGDLDGIKSVMEEIAAHFKYSRMPALPQNFQNGYTRLVEQGVDARLAADIAQRVFQELSFRNDTEQESVDRAICAEIRSLLPRIPPSTEKARVIALVGPTGVGKTTTIAKLAAISKLLSGADVALISADTYRIGAIEQLRTFAAIADIPIEVVYKPAEFGTALRKFREKDFIFIDTVGRSQRMKKDLQELSRTVEAAKADEVHLVMSASTSAPLLEEVVHRFKVTKPSRLVFTKLDETGACGNLLTVAVKSGLPISYVTTGQTVPDDILAGEPEKLSSIIYTGEVLHA